MFWDLILILITTLRHKGKSPQNSLFTAATQEMRSSPLPSHFSNGRAHDITEGFFTLGSPPLVCVIITKVKDELILHYLYSYCTQILAFIMWLLKNILNIFLLIASTLIVQCKTSAVTVAILFFLLCFWGEKTAHSLTVFCLSDSPTYPFFYILHRDVFPQLYTLSSSHPDLHFLSALLQSRSNYADSCLSSKSL